jgi:hypothetical protein
MIMGKRNTNALGMSDPNLSTVHYCSFYLKLLLLTHGTTHTHLQIGSTTVRQQRETNTEYMFAVFSELPSSPGKKKSSDKLGIIDPLMCKNRKETEIRPFAYFQLVATCVISFSFLAYFLVLFLVFRNSLTGLVFFFYLRDAEAIWNREFFQTVCGWNICLI